MFTRAPLGATMIEEFGVYMNQDQLDLFQGYMAEIRAADAESREVIRPAVEAAGVLDGVDFESEFSLLADFNGEWPIIDADMTDLLDTMEGNLDNFAAVKALPPFDLFPWFFVIPGLLIAGLAAVTLRIGSSRRPSRQILALVALGVAVVLAPVFFQMFTRAPKGGDMINDFRPMMTRERVVNVQGYFATIGNGEADLRNKVVPLALDGAGLGDAEVVAATALSANWAEIVGEFFPMIGAMSDNVDNFEAVDALPPFPLFPWFFVLPGVLVAGLAWWSRVPPDSTESDSTESDHVGV
jgi:hypothetical protein